MADTNELTPVSEGPRLTNEQREALLSFIESANDDDVRILLEHVRQERAAIATQRMLSELTRNELHSAFSQIYERLGAIRNYIVHGTASSVR